MTAALIPSVLDHPRRRLLAAMAAAPLAFAWPRPAPAAGSKPVGFGAMLRQRLAEDGVGFAAVQVSPSGLELQTLGVLRQGAAQPVTAQTLFELGSMTKAFVALAFADGMLKREWSPDDPVEMALPEGSRLRDANGEPLRLIDLATHRSGLPRMPGDMGRKEMIAPYGYYTEARLHHYLRTWKPTRVRGAAFEYSNLGYGLLALVLARRVGLSVDELLSRRVFIPLRMTDLFIRRPLPAGDDLGVVAAALQAGLAHRAREATGHQSRRPTSAWQFDALAGAIGVVGSIEPVGRFIQAALGLVEHPLGEAFALCLQYRTEGEHPLRPFGLAWEMAPMVGHGNDRMLFNQDGATGGFSSSMWIEPARRRGAAVLANAFIETRSLALLGLDQGIRDEDFSRMALPPEALAPLAGSYASDPRLRLDLRVRDGRLWAQGPGISEFELLPSAPRRFFARDSELEVNFDEADRPQSLMVLREGKGLPFFRLP